MRAPPLPVFENKTLAPDRSSKRFCNENAQTQPGPLLDMSATLGISHQIRLTKLVDQLDRKTRAIVGNDDLDGAASQLANMITDERAKSAALSTKFPMP